MGIDSDYKRKANNFVDSEVIKEKVQLTYKFLSKNSYCNITEILALVLI